MHITKTKHFSINFDILLIEILLAIICWFLWYNNLLPLVLPIITTALATLGTGLAIYVLIQALIMIKASKKDD